MATGMVLATLCLATGPLSIGAEYMPDIHWPVPKVIQPGDGTTPPSDAIVLFDGKDMAAWNGAEKWQVKDGCVISGGNEVTSKQSFGDCQLHVEWAAPEKVVGSGQGRGNSGVYMMGLYEIQVLDCYHNETYADGQAGAVYKQHPPLVNACRKPGQWQTYDIIWEAPRFIASGKMEKPAYVTVLYNGVVVQNHFALTGQTSWEQPAKYLPHPARLPLKLQFHGNPVRYRNIWIREIQDIKSLPGKDPKPHH
jgi:hypothetical protein